ncbi:group III truncated hemoglobin [Sphingobium lignivorans]|uniref:Hemoglobin n=1 Tax=Sphingobium lignivorans TaxID=2735886 RepID=A0ABR6NKJ1_9SPHN|nr:group III truncated hemoglobin [Sphingobium lignivorans]MBB5987805.1 hemoglobin [Sphingobium lignivorans]
MTQEIHDGLLELDEEGLSRLVAAFYERVRADAALGPIFDDAIDDWPAHLEKLAAFWSSVMLTSGRYKGRPVPAHMKHRARITPALFERWLNLWAQVSNQLMTPAAALALQDRAQRIAQSLQLAMFFGPDDLAAVDRQRAARSLTDAGRP